MRAIPLRRQLALVAWLTVSMAPWPRACLAGPPDTGGAPSGWHANRGNPADQPAGPDAPPLPGADVALGGTREPVVTVSPTNSQNVAMSSLFQYRISVNNGVTWTAAASNVVPSGYGQDGDASMAFD